ncbi:hypothetical protein CEXT_235311 [Caerostris extrusa]|uniref:Uncharacterized protein n=1 Tax=Caerostris extrusa TaxID=172846 RepID=A0AAV4Y6W6_CAEEX|nr:hypothetical protein CEXT_235311 [Caerostris extrusa]
MSADTKRSCFFPSQSRRGGEWQEEAFDLVLGNQSHSAAHLALLRPTAFLFKSYYCLASREKSTIEMSMPPKGNFFPLDDVWDRTITLTRQKNTVAPSNIFSIPSISSHSPYIYLVQIFNRS